MNVLPVIERELRVTARQPLNRWLRFGGAAGLFALMLALGEQQAWGGRQQGARLFSALNLALFGGIWLFGPLLSADCLSREKREGTLGLLFLTPLSSLDIALAKVLTHALSALTLLVAAAPMLMVPVLFGGVAWMDVARAVLLNLGALCLALSAGLLASAFSRDWARAMVLSVLMSFGSAFVFLSAYAIGRVWRYFQLAQGRSAVGFLDYYWDGFIRRWYDWISSGGVFSRGFSGTWGVGTTDLWLLGLAAGLLLFAVSLAGLATLVASHQIGRVWNADAGSARPLRLKEVFFRPFIGQSSLRRRMRRRMERNPIAWLHQRSWSTRMAKWGWCGLILVGLILAFMFGGLVNVMVWLKRMELLVVVGIAFTAASSFRKDRESGVMEALLVTPLTERQILGGRLWGIWQQFFPAMLMLGLVYLVMAGLTKPLAGSWHTRLDLALFPLLHQTGLYLALPSIGLYFGLRRMHLLVAVSLSLLVGLWLPYYLAEPVWRGWWWLCVTVGQETSFSGSYLLAFPFGCRLALAMVAWCLLNWNVRHRRFLLA